LAKWSWTCQHLYTTLLSWEWAHAAEWYTHPKNMLASMKMAKFGLNHFFSIKTKQKSNKEFDKLTVGNSEFIECEVCHFE
jgi:hypothetical protein